MRRRPRRVMLGRLSNHDTEFPRSLAARKRGACSCLGALLWSPVLEAGVGVDAGDGAGLRRLGSHGNCAYRVRTTGLEASERKIEGPGMSTAARAPARSGVADSTGGAEFGAARTT